MSDGYTADEYGDLLRRMQILDKKLARIAALCDDVELGVAYSMGNAELPEWVPLVRDILTDSGPE